MRLPMPIIIGADSYHSINLKTPKQGVITDATKLAKSDIHRAIYTFILGCTVSLSSDDESIEDYKRIKVMLTELPWKSAETVVIECAKIYHGGDDAVEGNYKCTKCDHINVAMLDEENDIDTRDFLSDLKMNILGVNDKGETTDIERELLFEFDPPVEIKGGDEGFEMIESIVMEYPTVKHMFSAVAKVGQADDIDLQHQVFINCIIKVNGVETPSKFRSRWGNQFLRNIENPDDMHNIIETLEWPGIDPTLKKRCVKCSNYFETTLEAGNFFVSALGSKGRTGSESQKKVG